MLAQFIAAAEALGSHIVKTNGIDDTASHLCRLVGTDAVLTTPLPAALAERLANLPRAAESAVASTRLCISHAAAAIAATGTLLIDLDAAEGRAATALTPVHAVVLGASTIVPTLQALAPQLANRLAAPGNCYFSLTSGPSRTADIERVLTIGVHGAKELHIFIDLEG